MVHCSVIYANGVIYAKYVPNMQTLSFLNFFFEVTLATVPAYSCGHNRHITHIFHAIFADFRYVYCVFDSVIT
jgi:hypothetical protein